MEVNMFLFDGAISKYKHIPFLWGKIFHMQGENCNKLKFFPWGLWEGNVSAAPAQANNIIEYCIEIII